MSKFIWLNKVFTGGMNDALPAHLIPENQAQLIQNLKLENGVWKEIKEPAECPDFPDHLLVGLSRMYYWEPNYVPLSCPDTFVYVCFFVNGDVQLVYRGELGDGAWSATTLSTFYGEYDTETSVYSPAPVQSFILTGSNLTGSYATLTAPAYFKITAATTPVEEDWVSSLVVNVVDNAISSTIKVRFSPVSMDTIDNVINIVIDDASVNPLNVAVHGEVLEIVPLPQQGELLYWMESFDDDAVDKMTIVAGEVTAWDSIAPVIEFVPTAETDNDPPASALRPIIATAHLIDGSTDTDVPQFTLGTAYRARNVVGTVASSGFGGAGAWNGLTLAAAINLNQTVSGSTEMTVASYRGKYTVYETRGWKIAFYHTNALGAAEIRMTLMGNSDSASNYYYSKVFPEDLIDTGWMLLLAVWDAAAMTFKVYCAIGNTITQFDAAGFSGSNPGLNVTLTQTKAAIGSYLSSLAGNPLTDPLMGEMPTNVCWHTKLTDSEIIQTFKYYKYKYKNIFTYDPESI